MLCAVSPNTWFTWQWNYKSDELDILEGKWLTDSIVSAYQRIKMNSSSYWGWGGGGGGGWGGCKTALKVQHMAFIQNLFKLLISIIATGLLFLQLELVLDAFSGWTACIHLHQTKARS